MDLSRAANTDWAARIAEQLGEGGLPKTPLGQQRFAVATGASLGLGELLVADSGLVAELDQPALPDPIHAVLEAEPGTIATAQRGGLLTIAVRDLMGEMNTQQAAAALSDLADAVLKRVHQDIGELPEAGDASLSVLAMGKLGGQELNYVSDVDVIFVHEGDQQAAVRLAQHFLEQSSGCYEMDAGLRPEGRSGVLSRSVDSYLAYHERWGRPWELQALLKLREVAGSSALTKGLISGLEPLVWPEARGADAVTEIQSMKARVEQSRPVRRDGDRQLKLGPGGLRDIEFAVQLLQMVHGPADAHIRQRGTLPALGSLADRGYVDDGDANFFGDAYRFLRTVEHRLQLWGLRRTHTMPEDPDDIHRLALILGFRDLPRRSASVEFEKELGRVRRGVRRLHEQLFFRPLLSTVADWDRSERLDGAPEGDTPAARLDRDGASLRLGALGFDFPAVALADVEALVAGPSRTARQLRVVLPAMLDALSKSPDPDRGLRALREVADTMRGTPGFLRLIRDNPYNAAFLASVLGRSPRLSRWFLRQPEALQLCADRAALREPADYDEAVAAARKVIDRGGGPGGTDSLRRHKRREVLRVALRAVTGDADVAQAGRELSAIGEGVVDAALAAVRNGLTDEQRSCELAVIALGRFGAAELGFASDLDVMFVHNGDAAVAEQQATALIAFLDAVTPEGRAFCADTGLRPEGRAGPLTRSADSYLAYYRRWGQSWEMLALTQARPVAGSSALAREVLDGVIEQIYQPVPDQMRLREIRRMKARVESDRAGGRRVGRTAGAAGDDIKLGRGGLSDVEWTVQLLRMVHGNKHEELRQPGTLTGIGALTDAGYLTTEEGEWLHDGWSLLSDVRNSLFLLGERRTDRVPAAPETLTRLAALTGFDGAQSATEAVSRARRRIRRVFDAHFFG